MALLTYKWPYQKSYDRYRHVKWLSHSLTRPSFLWLGLGVANQQQQKKAGIRDVFDSP